MQLIVTKKIGRSNYPFMVEGADMHAVLMQAEELSYGNVDRCGICGNDDIYLTARIAEGFKYCSIKCRNCRAELVFGRTKANANVFFLRRNDGGALAWSAYTPDAE